MAKLFPAAAMAALLAVTASHPRLAAAELPAEFKTVDVSPAQGDCPGLSEVTLAFTGYADVDVANPAGVTLFRGSDPVMTLTASNVDNAWHDMEEVVAVTFSPAVTEPGAYRLVFNPGSLSIIEKVTFNSFTNAAALVLDYNVVGPVAFDLVPSWIKPADGSVIDLSMVQFECVTLGVGPDVRPVEGATATLRSADGAYSETATLKFNFGTDKSAQLIAFFSTPRFNGDYTLTIPRGSFGTPIWLSNPTVGNANAPIEARYTVKGGRNNNNVTYDLAPASVAPQPGRSVKELKEFTLTFDQDVNVAPGARASLAVGFGRYFATAPIESAGDRTFTITFSPIPTEEGDYTLIVNEGVFSDAANAANPDEGRMNPELSYTWSMQALVNVTSTTPAEGASLPELPAGYRVVIDTDNNQLVERMEMELTETPDGGDAGASETTLRSGESTLKTPAGAICWENGDEAVTLYKNRTYTIYYTLYNAAGDAVKMNLITFHGTSEPRDDPDDPDDPEEPVGIGAVEAAPAPAVIFNLQGIRVPAPRPGAQLPEGVYIVDGRKVIITR